MVVPDDTELQMAVGGVGSAGFVAQTKVGFTQVGRSSSVLLCSPDAIGHVLMEAMRSGTRSIVAPTGGLKNIAEDDSGRMVR